MKEQRTKQILICLAASLGCFWLGNRVGLLSMYQLLERSRKGWPLR